MEHWTKEDLEQTRYKVENAKITSMDLSMAKIVSSRRKVRRATNEDA